MMMALGAVATVGMKSAICLARSALFGNVAAGCAVGPCHHLLSHGPLTLTPQLIDLCIADAAPRGAVPDASQRRIAGSVLSNLRQIGGLGRCVLHVSSHLARCVCCLPRREPHRRGAAAGLNNTL